MSLILNIETATPVCSVALGKDGKLLGVRENSDGKSHATHLTSFIEAVLEECNFTLADLDAIAVSKGPGSYTGLRIGVSTAKGLCFSLDKPLIAVDTLTSMANALTEQINDGALLCPMLDARRMEVYTAVFNQELTKQLPTCAMIIDDNSYAEFLKNRQVNFFGDGAEKCESTLEANENAIFNSTFQISAASMVTLSADKHDREEFEDVAYFEPYYLKDFVPGPPKKMI